LKAIERPSKGPLRLVKASLGPPGLLTGRNTRMTSKMLSKREREKERKSEREKERKREREKERKREREKDR
jgi:hypothetical protein